MPRTWKAQVVFWLPCLLKIDFVFFKTLLRCMRTLWTNKCSVFFHRRPSFYSEQEVKILSCLFTHKYSVLLCMHSTCCCFLQRPDCKDMVQLKGLKKVYMPRGRTCCCGLCTCRAPAGATPHTAVHNMWFGVPEGECFGFLGVNGMYVLVGSEWGVLLTERDRLPDSSYHSY